MKHNLFFIKFFVLITFLMCTLVVQDAEAQRKRKEKKPKEESTEEPAEESKSKKSKTKLSKDEKKAKAEEEKKLRAELKNFNKNLDSYRRFKEDKSKAESEVNRLTSELAKSKELESNCGKEVEGLRTEIEELLAKLKANENNQGKGFSIPKEGLYYVVQIGAFKENDAPANDDNPDFRKENNEGYNKYIMGVFNEIGQADQLRAFLMQIDFKRNPAYRPFIVPYKDGNRVSLEDALGPDEAEKRKKQLGGQ